MRKVSKNRLRQLWIGLILLILTCPPIYQSVARANDLNRFSPHGRLVNVNDGQFHIFCIGQRKNQDDPIVIFEGGIGATTLMWSLVQPQVSEFNRVCSYDRAGYGWSDPSPNPRRGDVIVHELYDLLNQAGELPPYIFAGHSYGGILARLFAAEYPVETQGLILVDARHEDFFERMPEEYLVSDKRNLKRARQLQFLTPLGLTRFAGTAGLLDPLEAYLAPLPDDLEKEAWAMSIYSTAHWKTAVAEREYLGESYQEIQVMPLTRDIPLIVLTAENGFEAWKSSEETIDNEAKEIWMNMQKDLSELSSQGRWILVEGSGHYIYFDKPESIVDAVAAMLDVLDK